MAYRRAHSLTQLLVELELRFPNRRTTADGWIGDAAHASRTSDHNPWVTLGGVGIVTAQDVDDGAGDSVGDYLDELLRRRRDRRIKYVIHEAHMFSSYPTSSTPAWTWRPYGGPNAHAGHVHISVQPDPVLFDSRAWWGISPQPAPSRPTVTVTPREDPMRIVHAPDRPTILLHATGFRPLTNNTETRALQAAGVPTQGVTTAEFDVIVGLFQ